MIKNSNRRVRLNLEVLEERDVPSTVSLGTAGGYAALGFGDALVVNFNSSITGNEGVSKGGLLWNGFHSTVAGNVVEVRSGQYFGPGKLSGTLTTNAAGLTQADADALTAAAQAGALTATQTFKSISKATTVTGNGGLNVIDINGDITNSLILSGTANDIFVINVKGSVALRDHETLGLAGGVTADHVLYNFIGSRGSVSTEGSDVVDGTLLGPNFGFFLQGKINGEIIGGHGSALVLDGATVHEVSFAPPVATTPGSLSGFALGAVNNKPIKGITIALEDSSGNILQTVVTDSTGAYSFTGVQPGTYQLAAVETGAWAVESTQAGTMNGTTDGTSTVNLTIGSINLPSGGLGTNYDFSMVPAG